MKNKETTTFLAAMRECYPDWPTLCQTEKFWSVVSEEFLKRRMPDLEQLHKVFLAFAGANIKLLLNAAESPIEKIFSTWTHFAFFNYSPCCLIVMNDGVAGSLLEYKQQKLTLDSLAVDAEQYLLTARELLTPEEFALYAMWDLIDPDNSVFLAPQAILPNPMLKRMRFDYFTWKFNDAKNRLPLIIECDGYEYHKDSFIKDRKRDRAIRGCNIEVMRFSGSEIYQDPVRVSLEILDYWKD